MKTKTLTITVSFIACFLTDHFRVIIDSWESVVSMSDYVVIFDLRIGYGK